MKMLKDCAVKLKSCNAQQFYEILKNYTKKAEGNDYLIKMMCSWLASSCHLPDGMGLEQDAFAQFVRTILTVDSITFRAKSGILEDPSRMPEKEDLQDYLHRHLDPARPASPWMNDIMIAGLTGFKHLWEDLGLWSRRELSAMITLYYPSMASKNTMDMKWKKFIYKQLCLEEGMTYACRAPSCDLCPDYNECFG